MIGGYSHFKKPVYIWLGHGSISEMEGNNPTIIAKTMGYFEQLGKKCLKPPAGQILIIDDYVDHFSLNP